MYHTDSKSKIEKNNIETGKNVLASITILDNEHVIIPMLSCEYLDVKGWKITLKKTGRRTK